MWVVEDFFVIYKNIGCVCGDGREDMFVSSCWGECKGYVGVVFSFEEGRLGFFDYIFRC